MLVQELQSQYDFSTVESCAIFVKFSGTLDLEHKVTSIDVLHNKEEPVFGLET